MTEGKDYTEWRNIEVRKKDKSECCNCNLFNRKKNKILKLINSVRDKDKYFHPDYYIVKC